MTTSLLETDNGTEDVSVGNGHTTVCAAPLKLATDQNPSAPVVDHWSGLNRPKVIVLFGLARGGTNVVWNLIQSHPDVCGIANETGPALTQAFAHPKLVGLARRIFKHRALCGGPWGRATWRRIDERLWKNKLASNIDNEKFENVPYTPSEVENSILCLKSLNYDLDWNDFFDKFYPETYFVGLVRDGYALCNGWLRRGKTADETGRMYAYFGQRLLQQAQRLQRFRIVRFEDALRDPFGVAEQLHQFANLRPFELTHVRLKAKRVLSDGANHVARFGEEQGTYWFDRTTVRDAIDPNIDATQAGLLSRQDRNVFERHAGPILEHFQYQFDSQPSQSEDSDGVTTRIESVSTGATLHESPA